MKLFETIDEAVSDSEYRVTSAMFDVYHKMLIMESEGLTVPMTTSLFMESDTPKRESTLEKIIWFIPDLIRKFINFVRSKLKKLFSKETTIEAPASKVAKEIKKNPTGVAKKLAAAGVIATATTAGVIIYNKHKEKVMTLTEIDDTNKVDVPMLGIVLHFDIQHMIKSLEKSCEVERIVLHTYEPNGSKYEENTKIIEAATADLKNALITDIDKYPEKYTTTGITIQELMKEMRQLSSTIEKLSSVEKYNIKRTSTGSKDAVSTEKFNNAVKAWIDAFSKFSADTAYLIDLTTNGVLTVLNMGTYDTPVYNDEDTLGAKRNFDFVKSFILYNSFQYSPVGFRFEAISSPNSRKEKFVEPTEHEFEQTGRVGKIIEYIRTHGCFNDKNACWGRIGDEWFVSAPKMYATPRKFENDPIHPRAGIYETYELYSFIINSEKEFFKIAQFMRHVSKPLLVQITEGMFIPTTVVKETAIDDNPGCFKINMNKLSMMINYTQSNASSALPKELTPDNGEIFCAIDNISHAQEDLVRKFGANVKIVNLKSDQGYYKIILDGNKPSKS